MRREIQRDIWCRGEERSCLPVFAVVVVVEVEQDLVCACEGCKHEPESCQQSGRGTSDEEHCRELMEM